MLVKRADDLEGCPAGSDEESELAAIEHAISAYEAVRWPTGKVAGGKGEAEPSSGMIRRAHALQRDPQKPRSQADRLLLRE